MIKHSSRFTGKANLKANSILAKLSTNASDAEKSKKAEELKKAEDSKAKLGKGTLSRHTPWIDKSNAKNIPAPTDMNAEAIRLPNATKGGLTTTKAPDVSELLKSPSLFLRDTGRDESKGITYCGCGNICEGENMLCENCLKSKESVEYSGYLYLKDKSNQPKRYWYILLNKELYCIY